MHMAAAVKHWTLQELHSLPDDGNKYELIHGELFVTPPPGPAHETVAARLTRLLDPYVAAQGLGYVYHPRAVFRRHGSEVEPDLLVSRAITKKTGWDRAPLPSLVVEILSPSTRRRDHEHKRAFYEEEGVAAYWIVDPESRTIRSIAPGRDDIVADETIAWQPAGASVPLVLQLSDVFGPSE